MSDNEEESDWEWFAECFANCQNVLDDRPFHDDPALSPEENRRSRIILQEARLVGHFALDSTTRFGIAQKR